MNQLKAKENQVGQAVNEYLEQGTERIERLRRHHRSDSKKLLKNFQDQRNGFVVACRDARADVKELMNGLQAVNAIRFRTAVQGTKSIALLRSILPEL